MNQFYFFDAVILLLRSIFPEFSMHSFGRMWKCLIFIRTKNLFASDQKTFSFGGKKYLIRMNYAVMPYTLLKDAL